MMKKTLIAIAALATFTQQSMASVPTIAHTFETNVTTYNMTRAQEAKVSEAERKIKAVLASEAFRSAILNHTFNGKKQFNNNKGLTNAQIYQKILEGSEIKYTSKNNQMDMGIKLYYEDSTTVGYTNKSITFINCNTKFFNKYTASQVAHNMMHEWMHKIGFEHDVNYSKSRDYSVPYAIGTIINKLAPKF